MRTSDLILATGFGLLLLLIYGCAAYGYVADLGVKAPCKILYKFYAESFDILLIITLVGFFSGLTSAYAIGVRDLPKSFLTSLVATGL